jgi:hypothetical protein
MKTILIGNGFNMELGGSEFGNKAIINRFLNFAKTKDYSNRLYKGTIENDELECILPGLYEEFKTMVSGGYDKLVIAPEDIKLLNLLKDRYNNTAKIDEIGMEDYFVILRLFHIRYNDPKELIKSTHDGFCWQFFDAIYNDGRIQEIANSITPKYREYIQQQLNEFNTIYTLNYDNTVEQIAKKTVKYLHGDFETLLDQYNPNTLVGHYYQKENIENPVNDDMYHIFCNGLMGFSGTYKEHIMNIMENGQFGANEIFKHYSAGMDISDLKKLERLRLLPSQEERFTYGIISAKIEKPELGMHLYPMKELSQIVGELSILGVSPFNDEHIWCTILENRNISSITYYYYDENSKVAFQNYVSDFRIDYQPASIFWGA